MSDIRYTKDHEWVRVDGDIATVGITDHAQEQLGDVVFVELPEIGQQGQPRRAALAVVESVKAASDIYAPVGGEVVEVNGELDERPGAGQPRRRGRGLVLQAAASPIRASSTQLMDAAAYEAYVADAELIGANADEREPSMAETRDTCRARTRGRVRRAAISARTRPRSRRCSRWSGARSLDDLIERRRPAAIRTERPLALPAAARRARGAGDPARDGRAQPRCQASLIGMGYYGTDHARR